VAYGRKEQAYVLDLCDELLGEPACREHRFDWLRGDPGGRGRAGRTLPVDAYYPGHRLVIEFWEGQHDRPVAFFDKPGHLTISGVSRGQQRAVYDRRRQELIPNHGLRLLIVRATNLACDRCGRLTYDGPADREALQRLLAGVA
jgi:hypothetical protein